MTYAQYRKRLTTLQRRERAAWSRADRAPTYAGYETAIHQAGKLVEAQTALTKQYYQEKVKTKRAARRKKTVTAKSRRIRAPKSIITANGILKGVPK